MTRVLVVDDVAENRYLLETLLRGSGYEVTAAANGAEALEIARRDPPDLVVTDILMPVMDGFALCREWKTDERLKGIPFVFYTATYTEPKDEQFALSLGAERFFVKPQRPDELLRLLQEVLDAAAAGRLALSGKAPPPGPEFLEDHNAALIRKLEKKMAQLQEANAALEREIVERKRVEAELTYRNTVLTTQQEASLDGILVVDEAGRLVSWNSRFLEMWGIPPEVVALRSEERALACALDKVVDPGGFMTRIRHLYQHPELRSRELIEVKGNRLFDRYSAPILDAKGAGRGRVWYFRDVTEQRKLEEQLRQAQKMEAVGALAGGIAHDFNNILSAISGYSSLLQMKLEPGDERLQMVDEILAASEKAAGLTRSMLAFSRKQPMDLRPVDVNEMIRAIQKLLERLIGEDIEFTVTGSPETLIVQSDVGQLEHVLINLITNARDAMRHGGRLTIGTAPFVLAADQDGLKAGTYALITVSDTGCGIPREIQQHIFEPFFTTKEVGKGTGLGLAMAYAIVKRHRGAIRLYSEPGEGTTFRIYLPVVAAAVPEAATPAPIVLPTGHETILLVEDNEGVRQATRTMLREFGYAVLEAVDGEDALRVFRGNEDRIALVLCDLIMPRRNGRETVEELRRIRPGLRAIFTSGYTPDVIAQKGLLAEGSPFLSKPVSMIDLIRKIRDVLDAP
ncbi:MAG TPA: response regulator [bacterium]